MRIVIRDIWSPDLNPPSEGLPADPHSFSLFVQVEIAPADDLRGGDVLALMVASADRRELDELGFPKPTLVLPRFEWGELRRRIQVLLDRESPKYRTWPHALVMLRRWFWLSDYDDTEFDVR